MNKQNEKPIAAALLLAILGSILFMLAYGFHLTTQFLGLTLALAVLGFMLAALGWARWVIPPEQVVDLRDDYPSDSGDRTAAVKELRQGERELTRSSMLTRLLITALGFFGIATIFPAGSLGPAPAGTLFRTKWRPGVRLVRENGEAMTKDSLNVDSIVTVFPEGAIGDAQSQTVLIRLPDGLGQSVNGYVAYSKVCTHAGCPVALYRAATHELMCPCHQSIFNAVAGGEVLAGPADHALPQLPLEIDSHGTLRATGDYPVPVGPGFWERG
ncbi:MAG: Rieske 2Fe-2S domain-containing protein [Candidatus Eremiobacteraeota bacterium]|nr:Rieske 2Fe-2S domain-containing protein [Candidatus Eremiobacteraeota bacterium]